ncbi:MotE family protein [Paenibacillus gallinarum]|uniref:Kinesin n=1 Tax=Paenibacillus gallinarum TaxID=2762232 RepID=A0ABR8SUQ2_9BACL|nr:kinesin [Paenibacillus gallinarum]MBD7967220.1 kinesin [Paenibacillus gallinarum]
MVDKDREELERESGGAWEKFMIIAIPVVFCLVLVVVLLVVLNVDFRKNAIDIASKIPIVKEWIPEEALDPETQKERQAEKQIESNKAVIDKLKTQLADAKTELEQVQQEKAEQDSNVQKLEDEIKELQVTTSSSDNATASDETETLDPYEKQVKELAKMYGQMKPSKAAPIIQSMTLEEQVQLLAEMKSDAQRSILEKMTPQAAAEVTAALKNTTTSESRAIAALQSKMNDKQATSTTTSNSRNLDKNELTQTFSSMSADNGANLILETYKLSPDQAITILKTVDDATRSKLLDQMSSADAAVSAKILNRLMGSKN